MKRSAAASDRLERLLHEWHRLDHALAGAKKSAKGPIYGHKRRIASVIFDTEHGKPLGAKRFHEAMRESLAMTRRQALKLAYPGRDTSGWDVNADDPKVDAVLRKYAGKKSPKNAMRRLAAPAGLDHYPNIRKHMTGRS